MKKVIVTGANGFIGSNVCKRLCSEGVSVIAVVKNESSHIEMIKNLDQIQIVHCDLENIEDLITIIPDRDIDVFYHFAWTGSSGVLRSDEGIQLQNALWTARALKVADRMHCKKFVNAGSIMEKETQRAIYMQGSSPGMSYIYGAGKQAAHSICKPLANSLSIELCWAVITNAYGVGEKSPRFINSTIGKMIDGKPLEFTAATQNYDFVYIEDVARAFEAIGKYGIANKEYTIGSGKARPLKEFIQEMQRTIAPNAEMNFGEIAFTGVNMPIEEFDITEIETDCHFKPKISFAEGIKRTRDWMQSVR